MRKLFCLLVRSCEPLGSALPLRFTHRRRCERFRLAPLCLDARRGFTRHSCLCSDGAPLSRRSRFGLRRPRRLCATVGDVLGGWPAMRGSDLTSEANSQQQPGCPTFKPYNGPRHRCAWLLRGAALKVLAVDLARELVRSEHVGLVDL